MERWRARNVDLLLLTFTAGDLDALAYLRGHAFTANMTGNTVLLGLSIVGEHRERTVPCLVALAGFLTGVAVATLVLSRKPVRADEASDLGWGLALELPVMAAFCLLWLLDPGGAGSLFPLALLAIGASALGIQSIAVRRLRIRGVVTTFISGTMTTAVVEAFARQHSTDDGKGGPLLLASMFATYVVAAAAGALLYEIARRSAGFVPVAAAGIVALRCRS
jgi:uncharacterized membrane protein YoaK (UPF0700 family)